ncbi:amino acid/amide ABC transporter substrate-binding protein, HAAT family (TC 3.A.1.4.-) [Polaromonas sp. OV174]|uniref:branched-chain amino acid ABC transporter substrate-binding protein n=1 Tax=Polaromonas sp. OV174 TaxID=1855300 RepID=UPI0008EB360F|nr:branched-chain amino acid ABC transporter substrate-binding protein [Polaromonas sp. OV174]SFC74641.1 amino acid/amide ABC transporter substrate-binding protein, HAAT family (TC 3.A.1.4.-) [Polaromonas sp. OV174]
MPMKLKLTVATALAAAAGLAFAQDLQVVTIATVGPLSGAIAHLGKDYANGVLMAVDDLNAKNLVIGGKKIQFKASVEDDAADPKQGTAVAQKLCDNKVNGVVGHLTSGTSIPASRIYNDCGIPMVVASASNPALMKPGYKTSFRIVADDNIMGVDLAHYAADTLKLKKVAIVDDRTAFGQGVAEVFKKTALAKGMQVVDEQYTNDKATDFMAILTAIKSKSPDAIFYGGVDAQTGPMLRQMDQLAMTNLKYIAGDGVCTKTIVKLAAGAKSLDNVVCALGGSSIEKMPGGQDWKKRYDAKYPGDFQLFSPYSYDATMVLADAMTRANSTDPKVYLPQVGKTDYKGVTARIWFKPNGEIKDPAVTLFMYKDGKQVALN